jgi:malonyl CoA-acyl carrier protein transacylase
VVRVKLDRGTIAAQEVHQSAHSLGLLQVVVVPEQELPEFWMASVLDLVEFAGELRRPLGRERAA